VVALFSESIGRFVVEVAPGDVERFVETLGTDASRIGMVEDDGVLRFGPDGQFGAVDVEVLVDAYTGRGSR